nr:reverse transcriptase [Tanacetum cinerariifolium]
MSKLSSVTMMLSSLLLNLRRIKMLLLNPSRSKQCKKSLMSSNALMYGSSYPDRISYGYYFEVDLQSKARRTGRYSKEQGSEEVYVSQPGRLVDPDNPNHVYKLKKALYRLKQAPRAWYDMLSSFQISQEFFKVLVDPTLFIRRNRNDLLLWILPWWRNPNWMRLKKGKPLICYIIVARPTKKHLHAVKRIFRYLRGAVNRGLCYLKDSSIALTAFADADHAGCQDIRRNTSVDTPMVEKSKLDEDKEGKIVDPSHYR